MSKVDFSKAQIKYSPLAAEFAKLGLQGGKDSDERLVHYQTDGILHERLRILVQNKNKCSVCGIEENNNDWWIDFIKPDLCMCCSDKQTLAEVVKIVKKEEFEYMEEEHFDGAYHFEITTEKPTCSLEYSKKKGDLMNVYIDERLGGGYTGDDYAGIGYIQISRRKYLKFYYEL